MSVYSMSSPTYTGLSSYDLLDSAMSQPLSLTSTLWQEGKGGALESFGLGTALRYGNLPEQAPVQEGTDANGNAIVGPGQVYVPPDVGMRDALMGNWGDTPAQLEQRRQQAGALTEDQYKASPSYRKDIPYDPGMTETRAAALAAMDDAKKVREFYAQKRPLAAFLGSMAGQALDPINYIPVGGPLVKAAAVGRFGKIGGEALTAGLDAAANTAVFGIGTANMRAQLGDDVSWQALISQIATAGLIGSAFGTIHGAIGSRVDARLMSEAEQRLATLKTTQEARIALNEGIDAIVRGEDVNLSPNSTEPLQRVADEITAYHGSPHDFNQFSLDKVGTGEGAQAYGHGLYFAESEGVAKFYKDALSTYDVPDNGPVQAAHNILQSDSAARADELMAKFYPEIAASDRAKAIEDAKAAIEKGKQGVLYEVKIAGNQDHFLDWDKPISQQSEYVKNALIKAGYDVNRPAMTTKEPTGGTVVGAWNPRDKTEVARDFKAAGIAGIKYLDAGSRSGEKGSRNFVVFDDSRVRITAKNGVAVDTTKPAPEPRPEGIKQAEASIAKPEDTKALAAQYSADPATGAFPEEAQVAQLATEGRLTPDDAANLAQAEADYHAGASFGEALKSIVGCLL